MLTALGQVLPISVAVALSSVPILVTILILLSPKRNRAAIPFLIGWVGGMTLVVVIVAIGATAVLPVHRGRTFQTAIAIGEIIVGIGLLLVAVLTWRRAARAPANRPSRWLDTVERIGPVTALGFAIALNLRPKGLLLGTAAGLVVAGSSLSATDSAVVLAVYVGLASSTVIVPIILTLASPARMQPRLIVARDWLNHNSTHIDGRGPRDGGLRDLGRRSRSSLGNGFQV